MMIGKRNARVQELEQQLADMQAQAGALETGTAEAQERLSRSQADVAERDKVIAELEAVAAELREANGADEVEELRSQLEAANGGLQEAVLRYREVRLANMPDIPEVLVPPSRRIAEVDMHFEAAERIVAQVRSNVEANGKAGGRPATPPRRYPDMESMSPAEKIRVGLQQLAEREAAERNGKA